MHEQSILAGLRLDVVASPCRGLFSAAETTLCCISRKGKCLAWIEFAINESFALLYLPLGASHSLPGQHRPTVPYTGEPCELHTTLSSLGFSCCIRLQKRKHITSTRAEGCCGEHSGRPRVYPARWCVPFLYILIRSSLAFE